jgi:hypothetical protein
VVKKNMAKTFIGIFPNRVTADRAIDGLLHYGYRNDEVSVISKDRDKFEYEHPGTDADSGRVFGIVAGIIAGAIIGMLAGLGSFFIPGVASAFSSLGFDGLAGSVILGALTGGILGGVIALVTYRKSKPEYYFDELNSIGQVLVAVPSSNSEESDVKSILNEAGAENIQAINLNEYVEAEYRSRFEPFRMAGSKGGRKSLREKISGKV